MSLSAAVGRPRALHLPRGASAEVAAADGPAGILREAGHLVVPPARLGVEARVRARDVDAPPRRLVGDIFKYQLVFSVGREMARGY